MKRHLLLGALPLAASFGVASSQTIVSEDRTTPLRTSADGAVTVEEDATVDLQDQGVTAIVVDSDDDVSVAGTLNVDGDAGIADNTGGILIEGDRTANIELSGTITADSEAEVTDEVPGIYPNGRFGILLADGGSFTGNITTTSDASILVESNNSTAIGLGGDLIGNLSIDGSASVIGDGSAIIRTQNVMGDFVVEAATTLNADGIGSDGIVIEGDVDGAFRFGGLMSVTAYTDFVPDGDDEEEENNNDFQTNRVSGDGIRIEGNLGGGLLIDGIVPVEEDEEAEEGAEEGAEEEEEAPTPGQSSVSVVQVFGSGAALRVDGDPSTPLTIGTIAVEEGLPEDYGVWSFNNRGSLISSGIYEGIDTMAVIFSDVRMSAGMRNSGSITANSNSGSAQALTLSNTETTSLLNTGGILANVTSGSQDAVALVIESDSVLPSLENEGSITASTFLGSGSAIVDQSGTLTEIRNLGSIVAQTVSTNDDFSGSLIAADLRANTTGVVFTNTVPSDTIETDDGVFLINRAAFGIVRGDIAFGSGDDQLLFDAGSLSGDVTFGDGDDIFSVSEGTEVRGAFSFGSGYGQLLGNEAVIDADVDFSSGSGLISLVNGSTFFGTVTGSEQVDFLVDASDIEFAGTSSISLANLTLQNGADLRISVSEDGTQITNFNVADTFSLDSSSRLNLVFEGVVSPDFEGTIVTANTFDLSLDELNSFVQEAGSFILNEEFVFDEADPTQLKLTLSRRTAEELGIDARIASIYEPSLTALEGDAELSSAVYSLNTEAQFDDALRQFLPSSLDMALRTAELQSTAVSSFTSTRSDLLLRDERQERGIYWFQEQFAFLNRSETPDVQAYDGQSFSLAAGYDRPFLGLDILGMAGSLSTAAMDETDNSDLPNNRIVWELSGYAAKALGAVAVDGRIGYGWATSSSERRIEINDEFRSFAAEWDGTQVSGFARAQLPFHFGKVSVVPTTSLDWLSISEDGYTEDNDDNSLGLIAEEREASSLYLNTGVSVTLRGGRRGGASPAQFNPVGPGRGGSTQFTVSSGYSHPLDDEDLTATYSYADGESFELTSDRLEGRFYGGLDFGYRDDIFVFSLGAYTHIDNESTAFSSRASIGIRW